MTRDIIARLAQAADVHEATAEAYVAGASVSPWAKDAIVSAANMLGIRLELPTRTSMPRTRGKSRHYR